MDVKQLDEQDNVRYAYTLYDAYPTHVERVDFDSGNIDTVQIIKVQFAYRYARTQDDINKDEMTASIEKKRDLVTLMSNDYRTRSRAYDNTTTSTGAGASRSRSYSSAEFESDMIETVTKAKGQGLTASQLYDQCANLVQATRSKGAGLISTQSQWNTNTNLDMTTALAGGVASTISSVWDATKDAFNQVTSATNSFFSDSVSSIYQYDSIKDTIPADDSLHTEMTSLNTTYNEVAVNQSNINTTYTNYDVVVRNIIDPPPAITLG